MRIYLVDEILIATYCWYAINISLDRILFVVSYFYGLTLKSNINISYMLHNMESRSSKYK